MNDKPNTQQKNNNGNRRQGIHSILIIGAGPAGIATAVAAVEHGYSSDEILILEKSGEVAHMIASKYPDEKAVLANYKGKVAEPIGGLHISDMSKAAFMETMNKLVSDNNLNVRFHEQVKCITKLRNGQLSVKTNTDEHIADTVFLAIGTMATPRTLGVKVHEKVASKVFYDLQGLEKTLTKVLVVGGGDSAGEYAKILIDRGHNVSLSYRGKEFNRMIPANNDITLDIIKNGKLRFLESSNVSEVDHKDGKALVHFKEPQYESETFDAIVTALGTDRPTQYLQSIGIETVIEGQDIYNESQMRGLFLVGDLGAGKKGGTINFAFNSARKAFEKAFSLYMNEPQK